MSQRRLGSILLCCVGGLIPLGAYAQCLNDGATLISPQLDFDAAFTALDDTLLNDFPAWQTRYNQVNTGDPSPRFSDEDNSQSGIEDDDHLDLIAAIINGEPVATTLGGLDAGEVADIRASFLRNRDKVRGDLTFTVLFLVTVSIIDEIEAGDIGFSNVLQDLVAAYMTIGDQESVAFIRGFLITLSEIFIEQGVDSGDIPAFVEGATKDAMRSAVNGNFVASRYESYGDAAGATEPNILGNTGNVNGVGNTNAEEYALQGFDRQAWMIAKGVLLPPLEIAGGPDDLDLLSGETLELTLQLAGGDGSSIAYDWKRVDPNAPSYTRVGTDAVYFREYALPADAGIFTAAVCDDAWTRVGGTATVTVTPQSFQITEEPLDAVTFLGDNPTLSVRVVGGTALPSYQWYRGTTPETLTALPGETGRNLEIPIVLPADLGFYRVDITGEDGGPVTLQSRVAELSLPPSVPVITLLGANPAAAECGIEYVDAGAVASDDVDGDITDDIIVSGSVDTNTPGEYLLTYSVSGPTGSAVEVNRTVIVSDSESPTISLVGPGSVTVECGSIYTDAGATAADLCDGNLGNSLLLEGNVDTATPGSYVLSYLVADAAGNVNAVTRQVNVEDTTSPVLTLTGATSITIECGDTFTDPGATATDSCGGDLTGAIALSGTVDTTTPGSYTLSYSVVDNAGNTAQRSRTVTVEDTTAPVLTLLGANPLNIEAGDTFVDPGVTAVDVCEGDLAGQVEVTGTVDTATPGDYTITYRVSDSSGNSAETTRQVDVSDTGAPILTLLGPNPQTVECGDAYADPGATANDTTDGDISASIQVTGTVDPSEPGDYLVSYSVSDSAGNPASTTRTVRVLDTTPPDFGITSPYFETLECAQDDYLPPQTIPDACDGDVPVIYEILPNDDTPDPRDFVRRLSAEDSTGNTSVVLGYITVVDTEAPTIQLLGENAVTLECGEAFIDPGVTATDACDGDLSEAVVSTSNLDTSTPGEYNVTYTIGDSSGNTDTATRTVLVVDTTPPVFNIESGDLVTLECGAAIEDFGVTAFDACDGDLSAAIVVSNPPDPFAVGTSTLTTFSVTDGSGNSASVSRTYQVSYATPPVITLIGNTRVVLNCGDTYEEPGATIVDTCLMVDDDDIEIIGSVNTAVPGEYVLTYQLRFESPIASVERVVEVRNNCELIITTQPRSASIYEGTDYEFRVFADGGVGALSYIWSKDGNEIATKSRGEFQVNDVTLADAGDYTCTVTDGESSIGSQTATLTIFAPAVEGFHSADPSEDWSISLSELLRVIQFFNSGGYGCQTDSEDGFVPGPGLTDCPSHDSDYGTQDWQIDLSELLRLIQFFNTANGAYHAEVGTEDGFAPGAG